MMRSIILLALATVVAANRENYDVVPMTGKRGGGFIFDTNAIHKGTNREEINP